MAWFSRVVRTCSSCHKSAVLRLASWCVYGPHISRSGRSAVTQDETSRDANDSPKALLRSGRVRLFENPGRSGAEENWILFISISFLYLAAGWQVAGRVGVRCCQVVPVGAPPARRHTAPLLAGHAENAKHCCSVRFKYCWKLEDGLNVLYSFIICNQKYRYRSIKSSEEWILRGGFYFFEIWILLNWNILEGKWIVHAQMNNLIVSIFIYRVLLLITYLFELCHQLLYLYIV